MTSDARELARIVARTGLFQGLEPALLEKVATELRKVRFATGQTIFNRGDPGDAIYIVRDGRVRISVPSRQGSELAFAHILPGEVFGEIAVIDTAERSAGAAAQTEVEALVLPAEAVERLLAAHPPIARAVMRFLSARLRDVTEYLEYVAPAPMETRVARYLLSRLEPRADTGASPGAAPRIELGMSPKELALMLGTAEQKVDAAFHALQTSGAIKRFGKLVECNDQLLAAIVTKGER